MSRFTVLLYSFGFPSKSISVSHYEYASRKETTRVVDPSTAGIELFTDLVNSIVKDPGSQSTIDSWSYSVCVEDKDAKWYKTAASLLAGIEAVALQINP